MEIPTQMRKIITVRSHAEFFFSLPFGNSLWILGDVQKMESKQGYLVHKVYRLEKGSSFIAHNVEMAKLQQ